MKQNEKGSVAIIIALVIVILLGAGAFFFFTQYSPAPSTPSTTEKGGLTKTDIKGDINRDGVADAQDAGLIRNASPCNHADACWNKVVGKTMDGDNPIYTSDLDLNGDENVNEMDISAMGN